MRILLLSLFMCMVLGGCANQMGNGNSSTSATSSSSTSTSTSIYESDTSTIGGMMDYLGVNGLVYENEMEISQLEDGFLEGRKFTSNGVTYGLYRYDDMNEEFKSTIEEAKTSGYMDMRVNGQVERVPVHVYKNYVLVYPEGADITGMLNYFR